MIVFVRNLLLIIRAATVRLLQVNNKSIGAGVEAVIHNIHEYLCSKGISSGIAVYSKPNGSDDDIYRIFCPGNAIEELINGMGRIRRKRSGSPELIKNPNRTFAKRFSISFRRIIPMYDPVTNVQAKKVIRSFQPDLVHVHKTLPSLAPLEVSSRLGLPKIVTLHNYWPVCPLSNLVRRDGRVCDDVDWSNCEAHCCSRFAHVTTYMKHLQDKLVEKVDLFVTVSEFVRDQMICAGYPADMIMTVHNGMNSPQGIEVTSGKRPYVLFSGRLTTLKGPEVFIKAARILRQRGVEADFVLAGAGRNPAFLQELYGDHVSVLPWLPRAELLSLLAGALCYMAPSLWHEPLPMGIIESLMCGTPALVSRLGGMPELVTDGVEGFLVGVNDTDTMAEEFSDRIELLIKDKPLRDEMGINAEKKYKLCFTLEEMGKKYLDIYEQHVG